MDPTLCALSLIANIVLGLLVWGQSTHIRDIERESKQRLESLVKYRDELEALKSKR